MKVNEKALEAYVKALPLILNGVDYLTDFAEELNELDIDEYYKVQNVGAFIYTALNVFNDKFENLNMLEIIENVKSKIEEGENEDENKTLFC